MIADRVRQTSGGKLPQGTVFLSHMESIPPVDVVGGKNFIISSGNPIVDSFKFGNAVRISSFQGIQTTEPVILQSTLSSDWTIEFWFKVYNAYMNDGAPNLISVYDTTSSSMGVSLIRDIANNRYEIRPRLHHPVGSVVTGIYAYVGDVKFVRMYKKGTQHGIIINGSKFIIPGTPEYLALLGSNTSQSITSWNTNAGDFAIDEVLLRKDFGDDSTTIPTAPY